MSEKTFRANIDYTVVDRSPLQLAVGDAVTLGPRDQGWPGWIWAATADGRASFVPEDHLKMEGRKAATVVRQFNARDLSVRKGETLTALREVNGWLWCRNAAGEEGWLPKFVLS
ncbi:MAG: hypothetical protein KA004_13935 [Verrucomicrobiales bacterium]|nr:hypothetical protein [Verrucomicrobiales bacterium]